MRVPSISWLVLVVTIAAVKGWLGQSVVFGLSLQLVDRSEGCQLKNGFAVILPCWQKLIGGTRGICETCHDKVSVEQSVAMIQRTVLQNAQRIRIIPSNNRKRKASDLLISDPSAANRSPDRLTQPTNSKKYNVQPLVVRMHASKGEQSRGPYLRCPS